MVVGIKIGVPIFMGGAYFVGAKYLDLRYMVITDLSQIFMYTNFS